MVICLALLLLATTCVAETLPEGFPLRRGPMVLRHAQELAKEDIPAAELSWLEQFELIVTNGYDLPAPAIAEHLRHRGSRLFHYLWANGFTKNELSLTLPGGDWRGRLLSEHPDWLLASEPLPGPPGTPPSYYFDFAPADKGGSRSAGGDRALVSAPTGSGGGAGGAGGASSQDLLTFLAEVLRDIRRQGGYAGVFFDYAGVYPLPAEVRDIWTQKHPEIAYDQALAEFFERLREVDPEGLIFTNQACLGDPALVPTADYDMVESYGTSFMWGPVVQLEGEDFALSYRRPWAGPGGLRAMYGQLCAGLKTAAPRRELLCLDYMRPSLTRQGDTWRQTTDLEAIYYSYCAAALWGLDASCSEWYGLPYRGPLYFADLGRPLGDGPVELGAVVVREYERGLVALMTGTQPAQVTYQLQANCGTRLHNLLTGQTVGVRDGEVTLRLRASRIPLTDERSPIARVFLKIN